MCARKICIPGVLGCLALAAFSFAADPVSKSDLYGDPLPPGAVSRLGTVRFRQHGNLQDVTYSADGRRLIGFTYDTLFSWDAESGSLTDVRPIEAHSVSNIAFSADRQRAVTAGYLRTPADSIYSLQAWDLAALAPRELIDWTDERSPSCVALNAFGTMIAAGDHRGVVHIYEVASRQELLRFQIADDQIRVLAFSPKDDRLVVGLENETPFLWNWANGEEPQPLDPAEGWPRSADWSPDGNQFAIARDREDGVHLYDAQSGERVDTVADEPGFSYVHSVVFSPDGRLLATADSGTGSVTLWDVQAGAQVASYDMMARGRSLCFSPDGEWLTNWGGSYHARVQTWNVKTGRLHRANVGHDEIPSAIEFLPGDEIIATAGDDGTLRFWEVETGRQLKMMAHRKDDTDLEDPTLWIRAMDISPDGKLAATSGQDDTLRIWDVATLEEIYRLPGHGRLGGRREVRFSPDGGRLASCGDDFFLRVWDVRTGKLLAEHPLRPSGVDLPENEDGTLRTGYGFGPMLGPSAFSADAQHLIMGMEGANGYYVFDVRSGRELSKISAGDGRIHKMSLAPDDRHLLTAELGRRKRVQLPNGRERTEMTGELGVQLFSFPAGEKLREWTIDARIGGPVTFGPDGKVFAVAAWEAGKPVRVYETESGRLLAEIDGFDGHPWAVAFSNDGKLLATSLTSGSVLIWDWKQFMQ